MTLKRAYGPYGSLYELVDVLFPGVLIVRALLSGVCNGAPDFGKLPPTWPKFYGSFGR